MQLHLGELTLDPQHDLVVHVAQVIDPVAVDDERVGQPAVLEQALGLGVRARKARDLQAEDCAHLAQADAADQLLVAVARFAVTR